MNTQTSPEIQRATVVGDGAMGTVCALLLAQHGTRVVLWSNFAENVAAMQAEGENARYLPGVRLPPALVITHQAADAFEGTQLVVSAVPCQYLRAVWSRIAEYCPDDVPMVSITKGIEVDTLLRPSQIIDEVLGGRPIAALSGPSIAPEVAAGKATTVVAASEDLNLAEQTQRAFSTRTVRVYTNADLIGVELAGATKNVIAIAAGIIDGLGAGDNAKAALLTRGLVEITRLGFAIGAHPETFKGLAGIGDLVTTCVSPSGRNRAAGERIGRGQSLEQVLAGTCSVIEGIPTTKAVLELARSCRVDMPITRAVHGVLFEHLAPQAAIDDLMGRHLKPE